MDISCSDIYIYRERENRKNKSPQNRLKYFHGYIQTVYFRGGGFRECPDKLL